MIDNELYFFAFADEVTSYWTAYFLHLCKAKRSRTKTKGSTEKCSTISNCCYFKFLVSLSNLFSSQNSLHCVSSASWYLLVISNYCFWWSALTSDWFLNSMKSWMTVPHWWRSCTLENYGHLCSTSQSLRILPLLSFHLFTVHYLLVCCLRLTI